MESVDRRVDDGFPPATRTEGNAPAMVRHVLGHSQGMSDKHELLNLERPKAFSKRNLPFRDDVGPEDKLF